MIDEVENNIKDMGYAICEINSAFKKNWPTEIFQADIYYKYQNLECFNI